MKSLRSAIIPAATLLLTTSSLGLAFAQGFGGFGGFGGGGGASTPAGPPAWDQFRLDPRVKVKLDFRNASVDAVLQVLSKASQIPIVKDPALTTTVTLQSPHPQTLDDAFAELNAVLGLKNYEIARQGSSNFLIVQAKQGGRGGGTTTFPPFTPPAQNELQVYHIKYASASDLATMINNVYTQQAAGPAFGFGGFPGFGGAGGGANPGGGAAGGFGGFRRGGGGTTSQSTVKASADTYSNSLLVSAPSDQQDDIATIIRQIDRPSDTPQKAQVFKLKYALASDMQSVVQNILSGTANLGSTSRVTSALSTQNNNNRGGGFGGFGGGFFGGGRQQSNSSANGTVSADTKSNSLIVTSTDVNLTEVASVLQQLDKPATYESTTWVYVLKSARADVVANLLNEAVGNRTTNGPVGGSLTNPTFSSTSLAAVGSTSTTGTGTAGAPNRTNNQFQVTSTNTQNSQNLTTSTDINGQVVNVRNLTGAVVIVPNIDTNSVIISSPPEDQKVLTDILTQLDSAPKQVMIQTMVAEVSLTKADQFGIEYNFAQNDPLGGVHGLLSGGQTFGTGTTPLSKSAAQPGGLQLSLTAGQYSAFLQALSTDTTFNVLDTPRIFTTNNATAQINISQSLPYVTNTTVDTTGTQIINYNFLDVGLVLTVTPRITANGYVTMDVTQTANDFVAYTSFNAPIVNQREAQTTVSVEDGNTVVLGGIISTHLNDTLNKVPILGDIPLLGNLFRSDTKTKTKVELLVFLTPHVVTTPDDAQQLLAATAKELGKDAKTVVPPGALDHPANDGGITPTVAPPAGPVPLTAVTTPSPVAPAS